MIKILKLNRFKFNIFKLNNMKVRIKKEGCVLVSPWKSTFVTFFYK
jgi:hypothetical protein